MCVMEFKKSLYYVFRENVKHLSRLDFMRSVSKLTALYHKAYREKSSADKEQINTFVRVFLSQLTRDNTKTPQIVMDELKEELVKANEIVECFGFDSKAFKRNYQETEDFCRQINQAVQNNNLTRLEFLLLQSNRLSYGKFKSLFNQVYEKDYFEVAHLFMQKGLNSEKQKKFSSELLSQAVQSDDIHLARFVIPYGADVNITLERPTLFNYTLNGKVNIKTENCSLLGFAIQKTQPEMIKLLLESGADVHFSSQFGNTLLHYVGGYYQDNPVLPTEELIKTLTSKGLDIDVQDMKGCTALAYAVYNNKDDCVKAFLKQDGCVNNQTIDGDTVLHYAVVQDENTAVIEELIKAGADINKQNTVGETPLFNAVQYLKTDNIRTLLNNGANPHIHTNYGSTPLHHAQWRIRNGRNRLDIPKLTAIIDILKPYYAPSLIRKIGIMARNISQKLLGKTRGN